MDYTILKVIGEGAHGKVCLAKKKSNGKLYAIKSINKSSLKNKKQIERTISERRIPEMIKHPFIVELKYAHNTPDKLYYVLEYCPGGELFFYLARLGKFNEEQTRFYIACIIMALEHLHELDIIYRDLKPENLLVCQDGYLNITDFGLSRDDMQGKNRARSFCGTAEYLSPEVFKSSGYGKPSDWWQLGTLIYEMLVG